MELRDYIQILRKSWILILIFTVLGGAAGLGLSVATPAQYESTTQLYVSVRNDNQATGDLFQGSNFARQSVQSYVNIIPTESVLQPVIDDLGLDLSPGQLAKSIEASVPVDTSIVEITVTDRNPRLAAKIANAVGDSFAGLVQNELEADTPKEKDSSSPVKITPVQTADVPSDPVTPRVGFNTLVGVSAGFLLGIIVALVRNILDNKIRTVRDLELITDAPPLTSIAFDPAAKTRPIVLHSDPRSPRAESFRSLRTNLQFLAIKSDDHSKGVSYVVSSAGPSEGKSTTVVNLAIALADTGAKVALIDCDLRLPKVASYLNLEGGAGLTDVLIGRAEPNEVMQHWGEHDLYVLPAGKTPPNPSELLGSPAMDRLLDSLYAHFDYVLIDAPPLLLVTDAAVLSRRTDGTLLVAASGSTHKHAFDAAVKALTNAGGTLRGTVITMAPTRGPDSYGYGAGAYGQIEEGRPSSKKLHRLKDAGTSPRHYRRVRKAKKVRR